MCVLLKTEHTIYLAPVHGNALKSEQCANGTMYYSSNDTAESTFLSVIKLLIRYLNFKRSLPTSFVHSLDGGGISSVSLLHFNASNVQEMKWAAEWLFIRLTLWCASYRKCGGVRKIVENGKISADGFEWSPDGTSWCRPFESNGLTTFKAHSVRNGWYQIIWLWMNNFRLQ